MNDPILREVIFHGVYAEKYIERLEVGADSMFSLCNIVFKNVFPDLIKEPALSLVIEDESGNFTELFDPEQVLLPTQVKIHIAPKPDGNLVGWDDVIYAIVYAIIAAGVAYLLAPKVSDTTTTSSGSNFDSVDNVIGQGGVTPVILGTRLAGSRVVSHGIDATPYRGRSEYNV